MWFRHIFRQNKEEDPLIRDGKITVAESDVVYSASLFYQLDRLQIRGSRELRGDRIGIRPSHRRKPGVEFREYRAYVPGDDIRFVDWRASARQENIYVRQEEMEKGIVVHLIIDCSGSMDWGKVPKKNTEIELASVLSFLTLSHGDRLVITPVGGNNSVLGPISGKGTMSTVLRYLSELSFGGECDLSSAVKKIGKGLSSGGVVCILSDFLGFEDLGTILRGTPVPQWWVNVFQLLHPQELTPEIIGSYEFEDRETNSRLNLDITSDALKTYRERLRIWTDDLEEEVIDSHASYLLINTDWHIKREIIPLMRSRRILVDV